MNGKNTKEINSIKSFLDNLHTIQELEQSNISTSEDNTTLDIISFIQNAVKHFFTDNISIIKHKMNYNSCYVPKYWNLSQRHVKDIQKFVDRLSALPEEEQLVLIEAAEKALTRL